MSDNLRIWNALCHTDPNHTKPFSRAGGFKGTAVKPIWQEHKLTAQFGPCGMGWGMDEPSFQVVPGHNGEMLVFCTVAGWWTSDNGKHRVYGVGGDKIVTYIKANEQYNRPERWENDDEAFKKAFTDALMNAFKHVGIAADVHMGQFDDNKYITQMRQKFAEEDTALPAGNSTRDPAAIVKAIRDKLEVCAIKQAVQDVMKANDGDMIWLAQHAPGKHAELAAFANTKYANLPKQKAA